MKLEANTKLVTQTSVVNVQALKDAISDFSNVIEDFKKQLPTKT
jgi:hypothetical protein